MRSRTGIVIACASLTAIVLTGCGGRPTMYDSLYAQLSEDIAAADPSVLSGRRIVIDPGHGGSYEGAVGADSLTEAEVNLGVALYLWGLLKEAGADVYLTRSSDRDFLPEGAALPGEDLAQLLRDDLAARIESANRFEPEVFISIHHNSNTALDRDRNAVEIYYRSTDPGASLDLAADMHTHLARNLGIEQTAIVPGSYYVLRNSKAGAAVLGEASYISNPEVEDRLKLSAKQKLEAEAYFLGMVEYFSRGIPVISMLEPCSDTLTAPQKIEFEVEPGAGIPVDPRSFDARIDGERIDSFHPEDGGNPFCLMPPSMPNGRFRISFSAISVRGGRPVACGKNITLRKSGESHAHSRRTKHGKVAFHVGSPGGTFVVSADRSADTLIFGGLEDEARVIAVVTDSLTGVPLERAVLRSVSGATARAEGGGLIRSRAADTSGAILYAPGYHPRRLSSAPPANSAGVRAVSLVPLFGGVMHGKRIALDPAGGGADEAGRGGGGLRGATVNLRLAGELERALLEAGAAVLVTREGEEQLSAEQRVFRVNRFGADLAIGLRMGGEAEEDGVCRILHYPGSITGTAAAERLACSLGGVPPCESAESAESAGTFLRQTSCPAVVVCGGSISDPEIEIILGSSGWIRIEVEAILEALIAHFGGEE
jgi:N-acetylmuramoyl-L-alanine amidase